MGRGGPHRQFWQSRGKCSAEPGAGPMGLSAPRGCAWVEGRGRGGPSWGAQSPWERIPPKTGASKCVGSLPCSNFAPCSSTSCAPSCRLTVTQADLNYIGSISLDPDLIEAAGLVEGERVQIVNINNGERIETYVITGERGTGQVCLNGPAARRVQPGDVVVIAYGMMSVEEAQTFKPTILFPDTATNP